MRPIFFVLIALLAAPPLALAADAKFVCPAGTSVKGAAPPDGTKQWCELPDGVQQGPSLSYYHDGSLKAEANFRGGKLHGPFKLWHTNGQLAEQGQYEDDKRVGEFSAYSMDGTRRLSQTFVNGKRHGEVKQWHANGQLQFSESYKDGEKHGPAVAYYDNGQLEAKGQFKNGRFDGTWSGWWRNGSKRKVAVFEEGVQVSIENFPEEP